MNNKDKFVYACSQGDIRTVLNEFVFYAPNNLDPREAFKEGYKQCIMNGDWTMIKMLGDWTTYKFDTTVADFKEKAKHDGGKLFELACYYNQTEIAKYLDQKIYKNIRLSELDYEKLQASAVNVCKNDNDELLKYIITEGEFKQEKKNYLFVEACSKDAISCAKYLYYYENIDMKYGNDEPFISSLSYYHNAKYYEGSPKIREWLSSIASNRYVLNDRGEYEIHRDFIF